MTNSICCLVKIIEKDERVIAAVQFGIKLFNFFTGLNSLLIIFIQVYTVNYQNALDRLRVRMNIILLFKISVSRKMTKCDKSHYRYLIKSKKSVCPAYLKHFILLHAIPLKEINSKKT